MRNIFSILLTFLTFSATIGQNHSLVVANNILLPKDSLETKQLITSLNNLLIAKEKPNEENAFVWNKENVETYVLLDEINAIEKSEKFKDDFFYKPYLMNVVKLNENEYYTQISYIGVNENIPMLRASFELIAHKSNNSFLFSSPLLKNTKDWKTEKVGNNIFHYKKTINKSKTVEFNKLASTFDKKLNAINKITEFYCCENFTELQKLIGVTYKNDYNGQTQNNLNSTFGDKKLILLGNNSESFNDFDKHDLWHDRLSLVISRRKVNKPIDEACAYLYGGSWGISWTDIFKQFKIKIATNKESDWTNYNENQVNFGESQEKHLMVNYVVNALLVQKIEKEKGFAGVWEFLNCGKFEKENENYYKALEKLTGINKGNFNEKIWELINNQS
jgi:hypothetical protein